MPIEYPIQTLWPSARVTLSIRFDEFGFDRADVEAIKNLKPITQIKGSKDDRGTLEVINDPLSPEGTRRFLLVAPTDPKNEKNKATTSFGGKTGSVDNLTFDLEGIIPKKAGWKQNGIRTADTLDLDIKWLDMPIDPRIIRSCAVSFFLGTLRPDEFAQGIQGETAEGSHQPMNVLPDTFRDDNRRVRSNLRFEGWVDKWEMSWNDGEPLIKLTCTDNTRLLLKQQQPAQGSIDIKKPIDEAVAEYLKQFPQLKGISVEYHPTSLDRDKIPILKKVLANTAHAPNLGLPSQSAGGGDDNSIWDYLDVIVGAIGHTIRIEGTEIIIQRATSLLDGRAQQRASDPYRPRNLKSGDYEIRTFVWGRNISEMKISHEYTHREAKGIECRAYSPAQKTTLVARFPEKGDRPTHPLPGDKGDAHWRIIRVRGINDLPTLKRVAEDQFNNIFRNELRIDIKTKNFSSFGGGFLDPDLLDMKPGDNFQILIDRGEESIQGQVEDELSEQTQMTARLITMGYSEKFAEAAAKAYSDAGFQRVFRMKEMSVQWDADEGVTIDFAGVNYVEARVDAPLPDDDSTDPTGAK